MISQDFVLTMVTSHESEIEKGDYTISSGFGYTYLKLDEQKFRFDLSDSA